MIKRAHLFDALLAASLSLSIFSCSLVKRSNIDSTNTGLPNAFYALCMYTTRTDSPSPEYQAGMLRELGYKGMAYTDSTGVQETLKVLEGRGFELFAVYLSVNIDPGQPKYDTQWTDTIKALKGRRTVVWINIRSKRLKPSMPAGDGRAVEIVREIAGLAEQSGLKVALYPHYGFWMERVEDAVRVAKKVNLKNVGVVFNLCHWLRVDDPQTMQARLELARPYLFSVTINGADTEGEWDRLIQTLDRGSFDVYELLKTLNKMGYKDPIGLQCYGIKGDVRNNLERSMAAWQKYSARFAAEKN